MKNKKGFTLIELLAVIVVLALILIISTMSITKNISKSKEKTKYGAAKEITEIAKAYMDVNCTTTKCEPVGGKVRDSKGDLLNGVCVKVKNLVDEGYLEKDVTNPNTGKNISSSNDFGNQKICKDTSSKLQSDYVVTGNKYHFDQFVYKLQ